MDIQHKTVLAGVAVLALSFSTSVLANTCPTDLQQDQTGHWYSQDKPGWKSYKPTPKGVTVNANDFGGVVYSPERKRMACVYKGSHGKWVALVSEIHHNIVIDKLATDKSGSRPAWKYSAKHKDYACGYPSVTSIGGCQFQLKE